MSSCHHTVPFECSDRCVCIDILTPTANKRHICDECNSFIVKGEEYRREIVKFGRTLFHHKYCENCLSIREVFFSSGWYYEHLWEDMQEFVKTSDGRISEYQLTSVTKTARDKILDMIEENWNANLS